MIRLVAALLLVFFSSVHTWAAGDDGLFVRSLSSSENIVLAHYDHGLPLDAAPASAQILVRGADDCCPEGAPDLVSFVYNCMLATVVDVSSGVIFCARLVRPSAIAQARRSSLDDTGNIFRPPII